MHVGLDDGLGALQTGVEKGLVGGRDVVDEVVVQQRVGFEVIPSGGLFAVEEERVALLDVLVDAVVVVDGPGLVGGSAEQVLAVGYIRTGVACEAEDVLPTCLKHCGRAAVAVPRAISASRASATSLTTQNILTTL